MNTYMDKHLISLERHVRFDHGHPTTVQLKTALPGQVLLIGMRAGQHLRDHRVATPITIQVVRGEGTLTAENASYSARAGMLLPLAANVIHGATAETDLVLLVTRAAVAETEIIEPDAAQSVDEAEVVTLDVRSRAPRDRHARIFAVFDALRPGATFRLVNDHDPKPLKYQLAAERAGEIT
jgi:quercetin dioxygenase-like cupin family protein